MIAKGGTATDGTQGNQMEPRLPKSEGELTVRRKSYIWKSWQMAMKKRGMSNHGKIYPKRANRVPVIETQDKENRVRPEKQSRKK